MKKIVLAFVFVLIIVTSCSKSIEEQVAEQLEIGQKYLTELNYEEAVVAFQKIIELDPKNVNAYIGLDNVYTAMSDYEKAARVLEQGYTATENEEIKALWTDRQYDLGQAYLEMQDFDSATAAFDKAVELDSDNEDLLIKIAEACISQGDSELAASYLEHGIEEIGSDNVSTEYKNLLVDTYLTLAKACEEAGDNEAAEQYYDHILELIPDHEEAAAQKEHLSQKQKIGQYYEEIVNVAKQLIDNDISDIDFSLLSSKEFRDLAEKLEQPVLYQADGGNYIGVYPHGIYYGEMKDGIREGTGSWFYMNQNPGSESIYTGVWKDDYPNGEVKISTNTGGLKVIDVGNCVYGYFDGSFISEYISQDGEINTYDMILHKGRPEIIGESGDIANPYIFSYSREKNKKDNKSKFIGGNDTIFFVPGATKD